MVQIGEISGVESWNKEQGLMYVDSENIPLQVVSENTDAGLLVVHIGSTRWYDREKKGYSYTRGEYRVYRFGKKVNGEEVVQLLLRFPNRRGR